MIKNGIYLRIKNEGKLFTTDNVENLSESEIREFYNTTDKSIPLSEYKNDLYRRVYAMFSVAAENSVLTPGEFEKVFLYHGTDPGNVPGMLARAFAHFKMNGLAYIDRVLVDGLRSADGVQQKVIWATCLFGMTAPLSYLSMYLHYHSLGLTMPDSSKMNVPEKIKFLLNIFSPSLAVFSGILDARNHNAGLITSLLGSPTFSFVGNLLSSPIDFFEGNPKKAKKDLIKALSVSRTY